MTNPMLVGRDTSLSEHFSCDEFRCSCGCGLVLVHPTILHSLEDLRDIVSRPIHILSGCRCPVSNRRAGGTSNSQHLTICSPPDLRPCKAADIYIAGMSVRQMFSNAILVEGFSNGGMGVYPGEGFIHVDTRGKKARWARLNKGAPYGNIPRSYWS